MVIVDDKAVAREEDEFGILGQRAADKKQVRSGRSPAIAIGPREGIDRVPTAAETSDERPPGVVGPAAPKELAAVCVPAYKIRVHARVYAKGHISRVLPTDHHFPTGDDEISILKNVQPQFAWQTGEDAAC
jgi:hypothetical protein